MGGRSGIARGLSSAEASGFFWSAGGAASAGAAAGGRIRGAIGAPRFGGSMGPGSPVCFVLIGAEVSVGVGVSTVFAALAVSITDVSPPK
jgi:hypothetical protein